MVNAHSHAFQRDLRGAAERPAPEAHAADDFWSWREAMYRLAGEHDPGVDARSRPGASTPRWRAAGYGAVGEFHYVHHRPDGTPYADPNAMAIAVAEAAVAAGLRIVLLPAAYHRAGLGAARRRPGQRRFCDPDVGSYLARVDALRAWADGRAGRRRRRRGAQRPRGPGGLAGGDRRLRRPARPRPPRARARAAARARGVPRPSTASRRSSCSHRTGFLGPRTSVIHGIHVTEADVGRLAASDTIVVSCPTTEGSLGDGHFPALVYRDAGVRIAIGSDSNVRVDPFEETRELETLARRERRTRHALLATYGDLWGELAANGRASLGLRDAGDRARSTATTRTWRASRPPTSRSRSRPAARPRSSLRQPLREERLLGGVLGERQRLAVRGRGLGVAPEPAQQVRLRRGQVAVAGEPAVALQRLDRRERRRRARRPSTARPRG